MDKVTHVFLEFTECKNGIPRSAVGNGPQAKRKETGEVTPENQFFLTSKAGAIMDSPGSLPGYLAIVG